MRKITVIGAGVNGLCCGIVLAEAGAHVRILTREESARSTSAIAGAIWYPYAAEPKEKVQAYGASTLRELQRLAREVPESGVRLVRGKKVFHRRMGPPWWAKLIDDFEQSGREYHCSLPVADTTIYLPYLQSRFLRAGGEIALGEVRAFSEIEAEAIVNCTGLGARELCGDERLYPIRGQVLSAEKSFSEEFLLDTDNPRGVIYVIPRSQDVILGGTSQKRDGDLRAREEESAAIRERCGYRGRTLATKVGLRPGREAIRLEREGNIVHNYGHGGSGITLSWGCAWEVARLLGEGP